MGNSKLFILKLHMINREPLSWIWESENKHFIVIMHNDKQSDPSFDRYIYTPIE